MATPLYYEGILAPSGNYFLHYSGYPCVFPMSAPSGQPAAMPTGTFLLLYYYGQFGPSPGPPDVATAINLVTIETSGGTVSLSSPVQMAGNHLSTLLASIATATDAKPAINLGRTSLAWAVSGSSPSVVVADLVVSDLVNFGPGVTSPSGSVFNLPSPSGGGAYAGVGDVAWLTDTQIVCIGNTTSTAADVLCCDTTSGTWTVLGSLQSSAANQIHLTAVGDVVVVYNAPAQYVVTAGSSGVSMALASASVGAAYLDIGYGWGDPVIYDASGGTTSGDQVYVGYSMESASLLSDSEGMGSVQASAQSSTSGYGAAQLTEQPPYGPAPFPGGAWFAEASTAYDVNYNPTSVRFIQVNSSLQVLQTYGPFDCPESGLYTSFVESDIAADAMNVVAVGSSGSTDANGNYPIMVTAGGQVTAPVVKWSIGALSFSAAGLG